MVRLNLWCCNLLNAPTEFCSDIPATDEYDRVCKPMAGSAWPSLTVGSPMHDITIYPTHLSHDKPSMIFGGHEGDSDLPTSDQMDHVGISPAVINGIEYPVSLKPLLEGHIKSFQLSFQQRICGTSSLKLVDGKPTTTFILVKHLSWPSTQSTAV